MNTATLFLTHAPAVAAVIVALVVLAIGLLIWLMLPGPDSDTRRRDADIERQIQSLRNKADHAVQTRPRVRANSCHATPGHIKAAPKAPDMGNPISARPKPCGGGMCRHRADCSDTYCPGRLSASLTGTQEQRHASR
jgi:hypothetical protein